jgi:hypothetical protein
MTQKRIVGSLMPLKELRRTTEAPTVRAKTRNTAKSD